jgi:bifunctional DNA-binding transcriptional regulator/antitoxin component of YhaV-PrlF toxin-antitoxin module
MGVVVETDAKGRILLPAEMRRRAGTKRFKVVEVEEHLELHPVPSAQSVKGKYKDIIKGEWEELEEKAEELVTKR